MKSPHSTLTKITPPPELHCDLLIASDGSVLAHNLTPAMAEVLGALNPQDSTMQQRARQSAEIPVQCH
jgi:hypothetical protein